jgi:hypothetical protein
MMRAHTAAPPGLGSGRTRIRAPAAAHAPRAAGAARRGAARAPLAAAAGSSASGAPSGDAPGGDPRLKLGSTMSVSLVGAWETGGRANGAAGAPGEGGGPGALPPPNGAPGGGNGAAAALAGGGLPKADHGKFVNFFRCAGGMSLLLAGLSSSGQTGSVFAAAAAPSPRSALLAHSPRPARLAPPPLPPPELRRPTSPATAAAPL